jgi:maleate cis-trans isomerase
MAVEYAPRGLVGMLTPQANTTAEPEFNILWPRGVAMINGRLVSDKNSLNDRLVDYFESYDQSLKQFANAPIGAAAAACTGASYLAGRDREASVIAEISSRHGHPFITAALAVVDALRALDAHRVGLVSPYSDDLNRASIAYWQSHGFDIAELVSAVTRSDTFHPIYSLDSSAALAALRTLEGKALDAIVMLGTGMPTLHPIVETIGWSGAPTMSSNLCLAWRVVEALERRSPDASTLASWLNGEGWAARLKAR